MAINKIWAGPVDGANQYPLTVEGTATTEILPGSLVDQAPTGELSASAALATVFGKAPLFAREIGEHCGASITTPWAIGDTAAAMQARSGEFVNCRIAAATVLTLGAGLSSNGDGTLKLAATDGTEEVLIHSNKALTVGASAELVQCKRI